MRWKWVALGLLLLLFWQCGEDTDQNGNAQSPGTTASVEVYEFRTPDELRAFRFPTDVKGAIGFRLTRIEKQLEPFRVTPISVEDGRHDLDDDFVNTELIRILVFR
ncbi:MAG: hypothetical protein KatS3mg115_0901 [Candidatus Poribacteria bacterium]|nr:MAG: hypothetical protein KatS3mg115_0901 [Candidatus Poribacteria bacterium]